MRMRYPPYAYIDGRFSRTTEIAINNLRLVSLDQSRGRARVGVDLTEHLTTGASRTFVGSWDLVRVGTTWLLDAPHF